MVMQRFRVHSPALVTSFLTSLLSAITRRWTRPGDRSESERLLGIVSNVPGVVWEAWGQPGQASQRIDFISEYVTRMLGYTVEEWLATPNFWLTIVHPDDRDAAAKQAHEHFLAGGAMTNTFRWMTKDGRAIWCEAHSTVIHDEQGKPAGMRGVTLDITARKRAEEALRFAARTSEVLASSLEIDATLQTIAELAVPALADACTIALIDEQGSERTVGEAGGGAAEDRLAVPIQSRDRVRGTITFTSATPSRYDEHDRELAAMLAGRISVAIENAQLYRAAVEASGGIELPVPAEEVVAETGKSAPPDFRRKQILVVHRDPEALEQVAQVLRDCGARVTTAKSAGEAILALLQHHDLIVTDAGVPVAEGVTLAQQLAQTNGGLPSLVLRKPVDAAELAADVAQALSRSGAA